MGAPPVEGDPKNGYAPLVQSAHGTGAAPSRTRRWSRRTVGAAVASLCVAAVGLAVFLESGKVASLHSRVASDVLLAEEEGSPAGSMYGIPTPDVLAVVPQGNPSAGVDILGTEPQAAALPEIVVSPVTLVPERDIPNPPQCGGLNENCAMSRCCKDEGAQCYARDENHGTCAYACKPGFGWSANWSCAALGERAPLKLGCSWSGSACTATKKCCHVGQQCIMKNDLESYCTSEGPGEGWEGTVVGGARSEFAVQPVPAEEARGTSLFCFMAILPGSDEEALVSFAEGKGASIFACEAHALFHSWKTPRASEGTWNSFVNTGVFVKVWRQVEQDGRYRDHDWTVKVDADSVFFPDRLREHLQRLNAPRNFPIYIKNTDRDFGFLGAIEVFSKEAMDKYFEDGNDQHCLTDIGLHSGEDGFMKDCMDMIGAGYFFDPDVLRTPAARDCTDGARVAFHAFKDVGAWEGCYWAARR